ncbi:MAG: YCF48-related protein [Betaproteobacteria bacterium]
MTWRMSLSKFITVLRALALLLAIASVRPLHAADTLFEFHNTVLDHYFLTIDPAEAAAIDSGAAGPGWQRTGKTIGAFRSAATAPAGAAVVCRFYGNQANGGPNGHFYTADTDECAEVKRDAGWTFERNEFFVTVPVGGTCPGGGLPVFRNYNGRFAQRDSNHRYSTDSAIYAQMIALGWSGEGIVFCGAPPLPVAQWAQQPSGTADVLLGVAFPTPTTGYACGINGKIIKTVNGGASWSPLATGVSRFIRDLSFSAEGTGIAVGESGLILRSDNGNSWVPQTSGTTQHLVHVHLLDGMNAMASGQGGVLLKTANGGASWTPMNSGTTVELPGVFMLDVNVAYAVGFGGTIRVTRDGGSTWTPQASGVANDLRSVAFADAFNGWAVGLGGTILRTTNGGETWQKTPTVTAADLYVVAFADAANGIVAGTGRIFSTSDGGATWRNESPGFTGDLYGLAISSVANIWAVGQNGLIFRR